MNYLISKCDFSWLCYILLILGLTSKFSLADELSVKITRGLEAYKLKEYNLALECFNSAIELNTNYGYSYMARGAVFGEIGHFERAVADFSESIRLRPEANTYLLRANSYYQLTNYTKTIDDYSNAIQLNPQLSIAYVNRAAVYNTIKSYDKVIVDCNMALLLKDGLDKWDIAKAYFLRGKAYAARLENKKALSDFSSSIEFDPQNEWAYVYRSSLYSDDENYTKALADLDKAILIKSNNVTAYSARGLIYSYQKKYDKGLEDAREAVRIDPNSALANNNLAWQLAVCPNAKYRDGRKAVKLAEKSCELSSWQEPCYIGTLAAAYAESGNYEEAVKWESKKLESSLSEIERKKSQERLELYKNRRPWRELK